MSQVIRPYTPSDRYAVRRIAFETALMGASAAVFFEGTEFLKDALTLYFTDYEPESAWVGEGDDGIVGYILGAKDEHRMEKILMGKIIPQLVVDALREGLLLRPKNIEFLSRIVWSLFKGELYAPSFKDEYPAILHINLKADFRGQGTGAALIRTLVDDFTRAKVRGVRLATMSAVAADFFRKNGFSILFQGQRSYLEGVAGRGVPLYILGRKLL